MTLGNYFSQKIWIITLTLMVLLFIVFLSNYYIVKKDRKRPWRFIHITKNAGTAFCIGIQENSDKKELCCDENMKFCKDGSHHLKLCNYNKPYNFIAIIRNPYSRFISAFSHTKYLSKTSRYFSKNECRRHLKFQKYTDVNDFIKHIVMKDPETLEVFNGHSHFHTQTDFLSESRQPHKISKKVKVIMQLENLKSDLSKLKPYNIDVKLPEDQVKMNKTSYPDVKLNKESIQFIETFYKDDFLNFKRLNIHYSYS
tara:strand:- start:4225 stop:4989 length:765 start_codon:yes stop_codon:yes gene_type:complete